jgi:glycosyltransferase involved in cell wall biosynthesis
MTAIVINAVSVKEGGSLVVLQNLLANMVRLRPEWQWHVVVNSRVEGPLPHLANIEYLRYPRMDQSGWRVWLWYETGLPALLKRLGADLLFSQTNYLPLWYRPCCALLLVQHAGHFSSLFRQLTEARLSGWLQRLNWRIKSRWVQASVRRADCVTVQTRALAERILEQVPVGHEHVRVIAHGSGQVALRAAPQPRPPAGGRLRVAYISLPGVQKNFSVLFRAASLLKAAGVNFSLVLTLAPGAQESEEVFRLAKDEDIWDRIENHGALRADQVAGLYATADVFVFPSLCESFGFPMAEAMASGIPLLIADTDSNKEVAGDGGVAFPAQDAEALASEIRRLRDDPVWYRQRAQASLERAAALTWEGAAAQTVSLIEELLSHSGFASPAHHLYKR